MTELFIIHGGGWVTNTEDIMRGMARELTRDGRYVVFSIDYRWAQKADGDATSNSMANIIEDVYGAIAHLMKGDRAPVHAVDSGTIAKIFESKQGGHTVYQFSADGRLVYYYAHLERYADGLHEGQPIAPGDRGRWARQVRWSSGCVRAD